MKTIGEIFGLSLILLSSICTPHFSDLYECYIITDVEVSDYQENDYEQVDCEEFMAIIAKAKLAHTTFAVDKEANLYDDEGVRYKLYISRNCRYFRIDSNYFLLQKRYARRLKALIGSA